MPVYIYRCESCGVQFDRFQKFTEQALTRCPECGKKSLRKVYTPVGIVFKGSGFYSTDHRSPSGAPRVGNPKSTDGEKSSSEKGSEKGSEKSQAESSSASTKTESSNSSASDAS